MRLKIADLIPGTNYAIQVRAVREGVSSEWSERYLFTTDKNLVLPLAPTNLTWVDSGDAFIGTWSPVTTDSSGAAAYITAYEIELVANSVTKYVTVVPKTGSDLMYTLSFDENVALWGSPQGTVSFRVRAVNNKGVKGVWSGAVSDSNPAPAPVTGLTGTVGADQITLKWVAPTDTDIKYYRVHVGNTSGFTRQASNLVYEGLGTTFSYTTTTYGSDHFFKVVAVDKFNQESTIVTSVALRPTSPFVVDTTAPDVPQSLAASITNNANGIGARASLTWAMASVPSDLAGFYVRYRKVGDTAYSNVTFQKDDRAGIIELQSAFQNYEFQIRSFDWQNNESAWSTTVTAASPANTAPAQVTGLAAVAGRDSIRYTWTPSTAADLRDYEVTFSTSSTFASGNITFMTGNAAFLNVGGLSPATTYYARVRAIDTNNLAGTFSSTNTTSTLAQLTPGDIGAPTNTQFATAVKTYSVEYAVNSSESTAPTSGWSTATPTRTPGSFIWTRTVVTYQDNSTSTTNPALLTGNTGAQGPQGIQGSAGTDGADGASLYTWVKYADTPTTGISDTPTGKTYIGLAYNKTTATESSDYNDYQWSLIKGADGQDGADGAQGPAGADGQTTYTWVKYATDINGTGISDDPTGKTYIGLAFNKTTPTESTDPGQYQWALIQGPQGPQGNTGAAGANAALVYLTATSQVLASPSAGGATNPTTSTVTGAAVNTTITQYDYSVNGAAFSGTVPAGVSRSGNVVTITGSTMTARTITVRMRDANGVGDTLTVAKTFDGATGSTGATGGTGPAGSDAYTILLGNEAAVFAGDEDSSIGGYTEVPVYAYKGTTQMPATIGGITGQVTGLTTSVTNNGTNNASFTVTHTTSLTAPRGTLNVPITVDGVTFYKIFSWAVSYSGSDGAQGPAGGTGPAGVGVTSVTPYFMTNTIGSAAPATPTTNPPGGSWTTTEPAYAAGLQLWRTERIIYTDSSFAYTPVSKVSAYTAATTAMTTANGKNKVIFSGSDASGTADGNGVNYINGDIWFKRDGNGIIIATWEFVSGTGWVTRTYGDATLANLNVGKLLSGSISTALITLTSTGAIQSTNYNTTNKTGFRIDASGIDVQSGSVRAEAIKAGVLGGPSGAGVINIEAGTGLILNGGYLKSNTYSGTTYNASATAGWFLNDTGLVIASGAVKASTLTSGDVSTATINLTGTGKIQTAGYNGASGFRLSASGLEIPDGSLSAKKVVISAGNNLLVGELASLEGTSTIQSVNSASVATDTTNVWQGTKAVRVSYSGTAGTARGFLYGQQTEKTVVEAGKTYIISAWARNNTTTATSVTFGYVNSSNAYTTTGITNTQVSIPSSASGWTRVYASLLVPAGVTGITPYITNSAAAFDVTFDALQIEEQFGSNVPGPWVMQGITRIDGGMIRTGSIQANGTRNVQVWNPNINPVYVTDANGAPTSTIDYYLGGFETLAVPAWIINTAGDAQFGSVLINGNVTLAAASTTQDSVIQSSNFVAGVQGWQLRSSGNGDLRGLSADSINGRSIVAESLSAQALSSSALDATISLNGVLVATGSMGETVQFGAAGFQVIGAHEAPVTLKSQSAQTVTLTTGTLAHGYAAGSQVIISGVGTPFGATAEVHTIASVPSATTFTVTSANFTSQTQTNVVVTGLAQGIDSTGTRSKPTYVDFPTDGSKPNIISGILTATDLVVTNSGSFRGTLGIEPGAVLTIASAILPPTSAPTAVSTWPTVNYGINSKYEVRGIARDSTTDMVVYWDSDGGDIGWGELKATWHDSTTGKSLEGSYSIEPSGTQVQIESYKPMGVTSYNGWFYMLVREENGTTFEDRIYSFQRGVNILNYAARSAPLRSHATNSLTGKDATVGWNFTTNRLMYGYTTQSGQISVTEHAVSGSTVTTTSAVTEYVTGPGNMVDIAFIGRGSFDFGAERIVLRTRADRSGQYGSMQWFVINPASSLTAGVTTEFWENALGFGTMVGGGYYAGGNFYSTSKNGVRFQYSGGDSKWNSSTALTQNRWVAYTWYDANTAGTVVPATGLATHETTLSPMVSLALKKRAQIGVTVNPIPKGVGLDTPTKARVWVSTSGSQPSPTSTTWKVRGVIDHPLTSLTVDPNASLPADVPKSSNEFAGASADPGSIQSTTGKSFWRGDDTAQFSQLVLVSDTEATTSAGNKPALRIGDIAGQHLRIDSNEIIAMESDSSRSGGELELSADTIRFNIVGGAATILSDTNYIFKLRTGTDAGTSLVFMNNRIIAAQANFSASNPSDSNTAALHASNIHSWGSGTGGGIWDENLVQGSATAANINAAGRFVRAGSSLRYKKYVNDLTSEQARGALSLRPVSFVWRTSMEMGDRRVPGFIAEEAHEAGMEWWVTYDNEGRPDGFRYAELTAAHNVILQEHDAEIEDLKSRVAALEALVASLVNSQG